VEIVCEDTKVGVPLARIYLWIAAPVLLVLCFLTQPLHSLDEPAHFLRVVQLTQGHVLPVLGPDQRSTGSVVGTGSRDFAQFYGIGYGNYMKPGRKTSLGELRSLASIKAGVRSVYVAHSNTTIYFPLAYFAPVVAVSAVRLITDRPLIWLYAGRLANAVLGGLLTYFVLRHAIRARRLLFVVALLPITLFQTAALSADSLLIPSAMALAVLIDRAIAGKEFSSRKVIVASLAGGLVGLGKIAYMPATAILPITTFLVRRRLDKTVIGLLSGFLAISIIWLIWTLMVHDLVFTASQNKWAAEIDVQGQLALILSHWTVFPRALISTMTPLNVARYAASFSGGVIGWLDTKLPFPFMFLNFGIIAAALIIDDERRYTPALVRRLVYLISVVCLVAIFLLLYLQWNPVGHNSITGVQGRYFLPLLPMVAMVAPTLPLRNGRMVIFSKLIVAWGSMSAGLTVIFVWQRYWG
jgi:uncharacterized membrane protein